jgi:hypothetical protein
MVGGCRHGRSFPWTCGLDTREGRRSTGADTPPTPQALSALPELVKRYEAAGGRYQVCPICFNARKLDADSLIAGAEIQGTIPMWEWIGDEGATTFSY